MNIEELGEVFIDGRIVNLENCNAEDLDSNLQKLENKRTDIIGELNKILSEI